MGHASTARFATRLATCRFVTMIRSGPDPSMTQPVPQLGSEVDAAKSPWRPRARIDDARSCTRSHCAAGGPTSAVNPKQCGRAQHLACGRSRARPPRRGLASFAGAPRRTQRYKSRRSLSSNCLNKMSTARAGTISADMFLPSSAIATGHGPNLLAGSAGKRGSN